MCTAGKSVSTETDPAWLELLVNVRDSQPHVDAEVK